MSAGPHPLRERGIDLLAGLVGFPSVSLSPNGDIVGYIEEWLGAHGIASRRDAHEDGKRFNLLARIGPEAAGGILLSGIWMWCPPMPLAGRATRSAFAARTGGFTGAALSI